MSLPSSWSLATLADCCDVILGQSPPGDTYNEEAEGLPFFQGKAEFADLFPTVKKWCTSPTKIAEKGDVLISVRAPVGPTNLCPETACIGRGLGALRSKGGIPSKYLLYAMRASEDRLRAEATGTTFEAVSGEKLRAHQIPLAPLPEQDRIVAEIEKQFTRLDDAVAALRRVQANLKRYRASVLKAACEGRLVPSEAELSRKEGRDYEPGSELLKRILAERRTKWEADQLRRMIAAGKPPKNGEWRKRYNEPVLADTADLPELRAGWAWTTLDILAQIVGGVTKGQKRKPGETLLAVPYLRVANVQRGMLDLSEIKTIEATPQEIEELTLIPGDILFNEGGDRDKLGRGWIWEGQVPQCIHQNHVFRARLVSQHIHPKYVSWYANSFGQRYFFDEGKQTTNLASLNMTKLKGLPIPLPPWNEQIRIVEELEKQLTDLNALESEVQAAAQRAQILRQAVLKNAFSGKLVPQDPNDEPASVLLERIRAERAAHRSRKRKLPRRPTAPQRSTVSAGGASRS